MGIGLAGALLFIGYILMTLPDIDEVGALFAAQSTVITDRNGIELYRIHGDEDRTLVPLSDIADSVEDATIAIEDERFYERGCFDPRSFFRAFLRNVIGGFGSQGGSTITQQFSKNALIGSRKKRITRKLREYILSCQLENRYDKDRILEFYLNRIPYGHNAHGVEQAARIYFAKSASGLTIAESAVLAALPQLPAYLSPYGKHVKTAFSESGKERFIAGKISSSDDVRDDDFWIGLIGQCFSLDSSGDVTVTHQSGVTLLSESCEGVYIGGRTDQVLSNMEQQGFISEDEKHQALQEFQIMQFQRARENIRAPHFVLSVREEVREKFSDRIDADYLENGGLKIVTTLDYRMQEKVEDIVKELGKTNIDLYGAHNAAVLTVDPESGEILAYIGNRDYWDEESDGNVDIVRAPRQPGSSFKSFSYAAAFLNGYSPATVLYDVPTKIGDDEPENFDRTFWGPVTIRKALGASRNIPAAKSYFLGGEEDSIIALAADMGITTLRQRKEELSKGRKTPYEYGWPLAIGAAEVPLYEMAQGYMTFARAGEFIPLVSILRIEDSAGNILYKNNAPKPRQALDPRIAYMITSILSDESVRPTEYWRTQLSVPGYQTAAKTGTSNKCFRRTSAGKCVDSKPDNTWTIGYTPALVTAVWAGNASGGALRPKATGLDTASHIWKRSMVAVHSIMQKTKKSLPTSFPIPEGMTSAQISELSGKLASLCTPVEKRRAEIFLEESVPREFDDGCQELTIDKLTGLLASSECPQDATEKGFFFTPHSILPTRWPTWEHAIQNWASMIADETSDLYFRAGVDESGRPTRVFRGSGAFLPLPMPLAPIEVCKLSLTPGRLVKPTLRITHPSNGGSATVPSFRPEISYTVGHTVREVRYEIDGRIVAMGSTGSSLTPMIRLPRRFDASGTHIMTVTLTDSYYNVVSDSVKFQFSENSSAPKVQIQSPLDGESFKAGQMITVRVEARDGGGGAVDRAQFYLGDRLITTRRPSDGSKVIDAIFSLTNETGETVVRVIARDAGGKESEDEISINVIE